MNILGEEKAGALGQTENQTVLSVMVDPVTQQFLECVPTAYMSNRTQSKEEKSYIF